ncbi:MAG: PEGA domain-containing protein [Caulobacterales bacterium]|nr:PEGA domain-containing protein [Caulobacterales bacterium]MCA0373764.1 PEGA domain-containing protein [Pseudomonadota bacterium]
MRLVKVIIGTCLIAGLTGCATVTRGTTTAFNVETMPIGAKVTLSTGQTCEATPCTITMPRKDGFTVTITKPGYKTWTGNVESKMTKGGGAGLAGNILAGGVIGMGVDASNGSLKDLVPNPLKVTLTPEGAAAVEENKPAS